MSHKLLSFSVQMITAISKASLEGFSSFFPRQKCFVTKIQEQQRESGASPNYDVTMSHAITLQCESTSVFI